jgi:PqqD family protein of HPr-rel-A system
MTQPPAAQPRTTQPRVPAPRTTAARTTQARLPQSGIADRPLRAAGLDISPVEDGYVVYDPQTDLVHHLNPTAAITLELCDGRQTVAEITTFLEKTFSAGGADVAGAVAACIDQLRELGLLAPTTPA